VSRLRRLFYPQIGAILARAHAHRGTSFVEIYQNCIVYNDGAFEKFAGKKAAPDAQLWLEQGKPMLFANGTKGLRLNKQSLRLEVVSAVDEDLAAADILVHDEKNKLVAQLLIDMPFGDFPVALGVIYCDPAPTFDSVVVEQNQNAASGKKRDLDALLRKGDTWLVENDAPLSTMPPQ
jgi:2-oxoglutarate/2-oxoacid ferredoxin oxidoreductase subunit beta